jgi:hypothetical protein
LDDADDNNEILPDQGSGVDGVEARREDSREPTRHLGQRTLPLKGRAMQAALTRLALSTTFSADGADTRFRRGMARRQARFSVEAGTRRNYFWAEN